MNNKLITVRCSRDDGRMVARVIMDFVRYVKDDDYKEKSKLPSFA